MLPQSKLRRTFWASVEKCLTAFLLTEEFTRSYSNVDLSERMVLGYT